MKFYSKLVGTTFRQDGQKALSLMKQGDIITLITDYGNPYDNNAIKAIFKDVHIGYIPKETAAKIKSDRGLNLNIRCTVSSITGGGWGMNYGCNIFIEYL